MTFSMGMRVGVVLVLGGLAGSCFGQRTVKPPVNQTKGTHQMAGGYVKFGEIYSLANGFNFEILDARYTMDMVPQYGGTQNSSREKLVVLDIAIKNWMKTAKDFGNGGDLVTLIDSGGEKYSGGASLVSKGAAEYFISLKPGEGLGQPTLKNSLRMVFVVPLNAEITKIMVNTPRVTVKTEQVLRYCMAGTDPVADPKNVIAPLPDGVRDTSVKSGAVALPVGVGKLDMPMAMGPFSYSVSKIETVTSALSEKFTPEDGQKYVVVTVKITNVDLRKQSFYDATMHDTFLKDSDGDKYPWMGMAKASSGAEPTLSELEAGESVVVRYLFQIPIAATGESVTFAGPYYGWRVGF